MRFYDGDSSYSSGYEKIKAYYPRFYYGVAEMEALWRFYGYVSDNIEHEIESAVQNAFIDTADLNTIRRIEEFIGVDSTAVTPEERRSVIKNHLYGYGKLSASDKAYYTSFDGKTAAGTAKKGTYTIVEVDAASGYGKLKSGAGWMPLSGASLCAAKTVTPGEKVVKAGKEMAAYMMAHGYRYKKKKDAGFKVTETIATSFRKSVSSKNPTCHCTGGASWVFQLAGYLKEGYIIGHHLENKEHLIGCEILHPNKTGKQLIAEKYLKPGDFVLSSKDTCDGNTACIFAGYDNGKKYWLEWGGPFKGKNCRGGTGENRNDYINIGPVEIPYDEKHTIQHVIRPVGAGNGGIDISSIIK